MSEPSEIRLVRCPKCENVLTEPKGHSLFECGGCGTVLRAKNRNLEVDTLSQKSDEERVQGVSEKIPEKSDNYKFSEKIMNLSDGSENDGKSNGSSSGRANKRQVLSDGSENDVKSNGSSSRRADKREVLSNSAENPRNGSTIKSDKWVVENDLGTNENLNESSRAETEKEFEDLKPSNGSRRPGRVTDWGTREGGENEGFRRNPGRDFHGVRYSTPEYSEEGPSNYNLRLSYGYGEAVNYNQNKSDEFNKVEYLEQDRAELLRKLEELKDQLSRSCDVNDKPKEKSPLDRRLAHNEEPYGGSETWFPDGSWGSNRASSQYSGPDAYISRPPYMHGHEMDLHSIYPPPMHAPNQVQRFGDPLRSQMLRRVPHQAPGAFQQQSSHPYFAGQYMENDMDPYQPYPPNMNYHHPSCSCFHCYNKYPQVPATAFRGKIFPDARSNPMFYHHEAQSVFGPRDHNPAIGNPPPLNSSIPQSHTRWPSDLNSQAGGFVHRRPPRMALATHGRRCRPIAGGAPFVTCYNCFELLQLPKKILLMEKNQKKIRCGGCSTVILFAVVDKKLVVSVHTEAEIAPKMVDDSPNVTVIGGTSHSHVHANQTRMTFSSGEYDNSGFDFQSLDREVISSSTGQGLCSSKSGEMGSVRSASPYSSEDEGNPDSLNAQVEESNSIEPVVESILSPPAAGSPLQDHIDYSNKYRVVNRFGKGNESGRSEREKGDPKKVASRQNSMKDVSLATEMEVSFNEYSNTGMSQESGDTSREEQPRVKGGQSFFAGFIKKSFRDSFKTNQTIEESSTNVTINGHPIPDRLLKKAEKLAGPIHPGQYWYDSRAGFWGVMGGPCLGIIPPYIEEFNYPMPENCAGGNTSVFVNGRELHQRDLNLLGSRGLPTTTDRSYLVEISGKVLDEDSREELDSLGKLAPTIEKVKHGFGMKVPRVVHKQDYTPPPLLLESE